MSQKYGKLKTLLQELFQLDQPDLDFGRHATCTLVQLGNDRVADFSSSFF